MDPVAVDDFDDFATLNWFAHALAHTITHNEPKLYAYLEAAWDEVRFERRLEEGRRR